MTTFYGPLSASSDSIGATQALEGLGEAARAKADIARTLDGIMTHARDDAAETYPDDPEARLNLEHRTLVNELQNLVYELSRAVWQQS